MARIAGVDLPLNKRVEIGLTYIFGIGRPSATHICVEAGVNKDTRVKDLSEDDVRKIRQVITDSYKVEGDLRKDVGLDIKRLMEINCYRAPAILGDAGARSENAYECSHAERSA